MQDFAGEKTLEPTPHRRERARREGHVARSQDLGSAAVLLLGLGTLVMLGGGLAGYLVEYCRGQLGGQAWLVVDQDFILGQWNGMLGALGRRLLPILGLLCVAAVAASVLQIGFLFRATKRFRRIPDASIRPEGCGASSRAPTWSI